MKKTLLFFIVTFSVLCSVDAQWYYRSCGVIDINNTTSEEFECLWKKATKNVRFGAIITAIGGSSIITGIIIYFNYEEEGWVSFVPLAAAVFFSAGFFIGLTGIPIWIIGANRRSKLKKTRSIKIFFQVPESVTCLRC